MNGYYYVATPYSKYPLGFDKAHEHACEAAAALMKAGVRVYCPIAHTHSIAMIGALPLTDHDFWMHQDKPLVDGAAGLIIVEMEGWDKSAGMKQEAYWFREQHKPVVHMATSRGFVQGAIDAAWVIGKLEAGPATPRSHREILLSVSPGGGLEAPLPPEPELLAYIRQSADS